MKYKEYQYNIYYLIKYYNLSYYWFNIQDFIEFKNGQNWSSFLDYKLFNKSNPWLKQYQNNQDGLGKEILQDGTFTPIFYMTKNNIKYIVIGKHRVASLILNYIKNPIDKKFLCIEIPFNLKFFNKSKPLFLNGQPQIITSAQGIYSLLIDTGDALTSYLWKNNCIPFLPFNDEKLFEEWLNGPEPTIK